PRQRFSSTQCISQNLRDILDDAGYSGHCFLLKLAHRLVFTGAVRFKHPTKKFRETPQASTGQTIACERATPGLSTVTFWAASNWGTNQ
ncbi:hypothetical protein, partial [Hydrogenophaga sp.]|uniref:hypothetical protein n=1 Tax=Hydrogenophaga sp. TaxID=1904254 RepID=UPI0025C409BD